MQANDKVSRSFLWVIDFFFEALYFSCLLNGIRIYHISLFKNLKCMKCVSWLPQPHEVAECNYVISFHPVVHPQHPLGSISLLFRMELPLYFLWDSEHCSQFIDVHPIASSHPTQTDGAFSHTVLG